MTLSGQMQNGVAVPDAHVEIPDGTPVQIEVLPAARSFWRNKTVAELAKEQGVGPISNIEELAGDWPPDESIDDFLNLIREIRGQ